MENSSDSDKERIAELLDAAWRVRGEGDYDGGREILKEVKGLCSQEDDLTWGRIFAVYAQYERDNGNPEPALELSKQSLERYEKSGNRERIAHTIRHIADIQSGLGQRAEAEANYQKALQIFRNTPEIRKHDLANAVRPYGLLLKRMGRIEEAKELLTEAFELYTEVGNQAGIEGMRAQLDELP